ncbi:MAG: O-antigen ligase family protein [Terracidiphilus sp.]|jgi:hypothetical protein
MRRFAWLLLLLFAFTIPWEFSLNLGETLGHIGRILGVLTILAAIPAVLQAGRLRTPGAMQWLTLVFYLWICCTYFWTIAPDATLGKMRGSFQEMIVVWLVWEFAESPRDLRALMCAYVAGSWVLAILTLSDFASAQAIAANQIRYVSEGQDPNDVARFLDMGFPFAALLLASKPGRTTQLLALGYLPLGLAAVLLTASREGFLAAILALAGCACLLARGRGRVVWAGAMGLPAIVAALWIGVPEKTLERLATIPEELRRGDLNQRWNIWAAGWHAFARAPFLGSGAGSFVSAAGLNPQDTAHNTALSILIGGGLCALSLAVAILAVAVRAALKTRGTLQMTLATVLTVWMVTSLVATVEESRTTWLLLAMIALAGRLAVDEPCKLAACFPDLAQKGELEAAESVL